MNCNGKCHMMKKMKEEEKKENTPVNTLKDKYENQLPTNAYSFQLFITSTVIKHFSAYRIHESTSHIDSIFHPPAC